MASGQLIQRSGYARHRRPTCAVWRTHEVDPKMNEKGCTRALKEWEGYERRKGPVGSRSSRSGRERKGLIPFVSGPQESSSQASPGFFIKVMVSKTNEGTRKRVEIPPSF